jgi:hypothetical protein
MAITPMAEAVDPLSPIAAMFTETMMITLLVLPSAAPAAACPALSGTL